MRFYQNWGEPWQSAAQRAQSCTIAYRSRQQPSAEEATAIMSPFFYSVNNGHHAAVGYDRRLINISYVRTDDVFVGDYTADNKEFVIHTAVCASARKAREIAQQYEDVYTGWNLVGTLVEYNPGNVYNRVYRKAIASTRNDFAISTHYVLVTDQYTPANLALLFREVYRDMNYTESILNAVMTRDPGQLAIALNEGITEIQEALAEQEARAAEEQRIREEQRREERRAQRADNPYPNLEDLFPHAQAKYPEDAVNNKRASIRDYLANIRRLEDEIHRLELDYLLQTTNNQDSEFTALIEALKADKDIIYSDERGIHVHSFMQTWDLDHAESLYAASERVNNAFSGDVWYRALMHELFCTCETKIMFKGFYQIRPNGSLSLNHVNGLYANPHHHNYNCFGDYSSLLQQAYSERAYMQWYGLFKACVSTVNVLDGPVMNALKRDLSYLDNDKQWLFTDGEFITTREWKRRYENNELHVRPGTTEEPDYPDTGITEAGPEDGDAGEAPEEQLQVNNPFEF